MPVILREFHRPARVHPVPVEPEELVIPSPPPTSPEPSGGLVQLLLPLLGSAGMFGFALVLGDTRHLIMAGVLAVAMIVSGVAGRALQVRQTRRSHRHRTERYQLGISDLRRKLSEAAFRQSRWGQIAYPPVGHLWSVAVDQARIWERRPEHDDFLVVRTGTTNVAAAIRPTIQRGVDPLAEYEPKLEAAALLVESDFAQIPNGPALMDLAQVGCLTVVGPGAATRSTARAITLQLALFRAPDDLRLIVTHTVSSAGEWSWVHRLPHLEADGGLVDATDPGEFAGLLERVGRPRIDHIEQAAHMAGPTPPIRFSRIVVIIDGYRPESSIGRLEILDELLRLAGRIGITFICLVEDAGQIPSAADATFTVGEGTAILTTPSQRCVVTTSADAPPDLCDQIARVLEPLSLRSRTGRATSFESPGLMQMLGFNHEESVADGAWWVPPGAALRCPIGVAEDGNPLILDLKESAVGGMGPHGMLIGATGSGKSELLRTLVLGLAVTHSPDDLAYVLIDFKGGATFGRLDHLPHSAGMITNLDRDPGLIDRMMEALRGELDRRQRVLHHAGGFDRADEYRAHRTANPDQGLEPLPALLVVVDEFGELLTAKPEFSDLFAMIGRVGRSLGVHLLLSTQRLDDGRVRRLEGHLRYRLALRTFTAEESTAVMGSRAAAELPPIPGVGYLKVDGAITAFKAGLVTRSQRAGEPTEMDALVLALSKSGGERARSVWLDPLPTAIPLGAIETGSPQWLHIPIGTEDLPREQLQRPFRLNLSGRSGHLAVVGSARTGKSTLLQTIILGAALSHDPSDLQVYGLDLGGGGLHLLEDLPHVGAVLTRSHRAEIGKLIRRLQQLVEERAERFRQHRLTDMAGYHELRRAGDLEDEMGEVLLVVDNWGALAQELEPQQVEAIVGLVGAGLHHGVHLILASTRWQDIKLSMRDNIGGRFELRLGDPIDSEIDRAASRMLPADIPGRGIGPDGQQVQVALPRLDEDLRQITLAEGIEQAVAEVRRRWPDSPAAPPVRVLPDLVTTVPDGVGPGVVMGLEEHRLGPWEIDLFGSDPHLLVLGDAESGRTNLLRRLALALTESFDPSHLQIAVVDYRRQLAPAIPESHCLAVATTPESAAIVASRVTAAISTRSPNDSTDGAQRPHIVVLVDDYDLVAGATSNPLSPLADRVAQGRDLGLHLVIARRVGGVGRSSFETLFHRVRELSTPGVVLSGDPHEGPVLGAVKAMPRQPGRGMWVSKGRVTEVQTILCDGQIEPGKSVHRITEAFG